MNSSFCRRFAAGAVLATVLIPLQALSYPDFSSDKSRFMPILSAQIAPTPGGLEAYLLSYLALKPSDISYEYSNNEGVGYLLVNDQGKQVKIEVEPKIVPQAISVVESTPAFWVYQVSGGDPTAIGPRDFIEEKLQNTKIGEILLEGDSAFAQFPRGELPLPQGAPASPDVETRKLFQSNLSYRQLLSQWESPPKIVPMISLRFDPNQEGAVRMEFSPEVWFRSPDGVYVEVEKSSESLAQRPYLKLKEDVKKRPLAYRNMSPELDKAAKTVAVMGYLEAACQKPGDCQALRKQTENLVEKLEAQEKARRDSEDDVGGNLREEQYKQSFSTFQLGDNPQSWTAAYKAVRHFMKEKSFSWSSEEEQVEKLKDLTAQQFLNYTVPKDALLQGASAVVFSWKGQEKLAEKAFNQAIALSSTNPLARLAVLKMGRHAVWLLEEAGDAKLAQSLAARIESLQNQALVAAYKAFDKYLNTCLEKRSSCSQEELRQWEDDALAELTGDTTGELDLDIAWLHGRFNYLVGIQLDDSADIRNRLRYLSHYTEATSGEHLAQMQQFEAELKERLVTALNPSPILDFNAVARGSTPKWLVGTAMLSIAGIVIGTKFKGK